jgi:hypothetical protein
LVSFFRDRQWTVKQGKRKKEKLASTLMGSIFCDGNGMENFDIYTNAPLETI